MEADIGRENHLFFNMGALDVNRVGKKSLEWDLNDWKWDGNLFMASPLNAVAGPSDYRSKQLFPGPSDEGRSNSSSSYSEEADIGFGAKGKGEVEKRRRVVVVEDDEECDGDGALSLKLGGNAYPVVECELANLEGKNGKRSKVQGGNSNYPTCQVEDCGANLSDSKDYHRRHKVCETHSKATMAMVNNVMQRFCQQCSRFHLLQEFDEGKRSCRRRLAGHNKRRRKTRPEATANGKPLSDDKTSSYLLISLLRILSNLHSNSTEQSEDQDLLIHLFKNLANLATSFDSSKLSGLLQAAQVQQELGNSNGERVQESTKPLASTSKRACITSIQGSPGPTNHSGSAVIAAVHMPSKRNTTEASLELTVERVRLKDFDLNHAYSETENCREESEKSATAAYMGNGSPIYHQSSPPQMSANSDSSSPSLSSSNGEAQGRTDRIVFKLFGKDPNDLPLVLRAQILDWLSNSPTDIEGYIRPGCIILTVYLRLTESSWEELCRDVSTCLNKLLYNSGDDFWRTGWVYVRIQHQLAFIYNGEVVVNTPMLRRDPNHCTILCVTPVAATISATINFKVKGFNLAQSTTRLLCAFEGRYLVQEATESLDEGTDTDNVQETSQCLTFSCSIPNSIGRGFIEVDDPCLSSGFFPFIVAEEDVCSEIRMLEKAIDVASYDDILQERTDTMISRNQALDFLNEMGWLLQLSHLRFSSKEVNSCTNAFSLARFRWLMEFSIDHEWCAVVKKLLDLLFHGIIDVGEHSPGEIALSEGLLHNAVRKNCKSLVKLLLRYTPDTSAKEAGHDNFLFRPDVRGPANMTPLHIAATMNAADCVLDALTDDPGQFGIKAWKSARDSSGFTPEDYAKSRGQDSYTNMVQKKINKQQDKGHVVVNIPAVSTHEHPYSSKSGKLSGFELDKSKLKAAQRPYCNLCSQQSQRLAHRTHGASMLLYRPAMLSMVGIAAVCVCVALLFKGPPEVLYVFRPFRWEEVGYGSY